ncbi:polyribonucleotide nucleotidyltransferase [bacterium]|nr:polyribonucleotide nucleotidyltransferase [bacterium]|tara:strand:- start:101 stop:2290 length:2190 start_codon:yes stop_codon:yes gene_type:complete
MQTKEYTCQVDGKTITATFSDLADQAHGSVIVKSGNTAVLATAVMSPVEKKDLDYFPLVVDYEEKFYAAGLLLGGRFMKREGRPSEEAILAGRMVDRTIRPLFDHNVRNEVQVVITVLSIDEEQDPDVLGIIAASLALGTSNIPWAGPVGAVRIGINQKGDSFTVNPNYTEREDCYLDMLVCGKGGNINMIETAGGQVSEDEASKAFEKAIEEITKLEEWQNKIIKEVGETKKEAPEHKENTELVKLYEDKIGYKKMVDYVFGHGAGKTGINMLFDEWRDMLEEAFPEDASMVTKGFHFMHEQIDIALHKEALENNKRPDGRGFDEVRDLHAQAGGVSDSLHGVGIFYRGGTHVLSVLTLGGPQDSQLVEGMEFRGKKHFMHHYNFPPFSSGETGRIGGVNRRAIGHGALAEKALKAVLPTHEEFPYTMRLVSESMASNGSTSMASVCGSTLALMDAGVPIKRPVAGIAMGLMTDGKTHKVLTDIQGPEDHHGDMDFKVAGTNEGITAIQMDVKVDGIPVDVLKEALKDAKAARLHILKTITSAIPEPRKEMKESAPRVISLPIDEEKIGLLIGPGGKTIRGLVEQTGAQIDVEQDGEDRVIITGKKEATDKALEAVGAITKEWSVGDTTEGEVVKLFDFGAVVKISDYAEGLVHISEIAPDRIENIAEYVCTGDTVPVKVIKTDMGGKLSLSIKQADPDYAKKRGKKACDAEVIKKSDNGRGRPGGRQ